MKVLRAYIYAAFAAAAAVVYGVELGGYWEIDAFVFSAVAVTVAFLSLTERGTEQVLSILTFFMGRGRRRGAKTGSAVRDQQERVPMPRSRIAHYVTVSRIKSTTSIAGLSDSPFERELLSRPGWRELSGESLEEVKRSVHEATGEASG